MKKVVKDAKNDVKKIVYAAFTIFQLKIGANCTRNVTHIVLLVKGAQLSRNQIIQVCTSHFAHCKVYYFYNVGIYSFH